MQKLILSMCCVWGVKYRLRVGTENPEASWGQRGAFVIFALGREVNPASRPC